MFYYEQQITFPTINIFFRINNGSPIHTINSFIQSTVLYNQQFYTIYSFYNQPFLQPTVLYNLQFYTIYSFYNQQFLQSTVSTINSFIQSTVSTIDSFIQSTVSTINVFYNTHNLNTVL